MEPPKKKKIKIEWLIFSLAMIVFTFWSLKKLSSRKEPCASLLSACSTAGYFDDSTKNKSVFMDCLKPLMSGQGIPGVTVSASDVNACKATTQPRQFKTLGFYGPRSLKRTAI